MKTAVNGFDHPIFASKRVWETSPTDGWLAIFLTFFICLPIGMVVRGLLLYQLWAWFVAEVFAVPTPSAFLCLGLGLFVQSLALTGRGGKTATEYAKEHRCTLSWATVVATWNSVWHMGVMYGMGYVIHWLYTIYGS